MSYNIQQMQSQKQSKTERQTLTLKLPDLTNSQTQDHNSKQSNNHIHYTNNNSYASKQSKFNSNLNPYTTQPINYNSSNSNNNALSLITYNNNNKNVYPSSYTQPFIFKKPTNKLYTNLACIEMQPEELTSNGLLNLEGSKIGHMKNDNSPFKQVCKMYTDSLTKKTKTEGNDSGRLTSRLERLSQEYQDFKMRQNKDAKVTEGVKEIEENDNEDGRGSNSEDKGGAGGNEGMVVINDPDIVKVNLNELNLYNSFHDSKNVYMDNSQPNDSNNFDSNYLNSDIDLKQQQIDYINSLNVNSPSIVAANVKTNTNYNFINDKVNTVHSVCKTKEKMKFEKLNLFENDKNLTSSNAISNSYYQNKKNKYPSLESDNENKTTNDTIDSIKNLKDMKSSDISYRKVSSSGIENKTEPTVMKEENYNQESISCITLKTHYTVINFPDQPQEKSPRKTPLLSSTFSYLSQKKKKNNDYDDRIQTIQKEEMLEEYLSDIQVSKKPINYKFINSYNKEQENIIKNHKTVTSPRYNYNKLHNPNLNINVCENKIMINDFKNRTDYYDKQNETKQKYKFKNFNEIKKEIEQKNKENAEKLKAIEQINIANNHSEIDAQSSVSQVTTNANVKSDVYKNRTYEKPWKEFNKYARIKDPNVAKELTPITQTARTTTKLNPLPKNTTTSQKETKFLSQNYTSTVTKTKLVEKLPKQEELSNDKKFLKKDSSKVFLPPVVRPVKDKAGFVSQGFKLRFFVEATNNFHHLFRPLMKCRTDEWMEIQENDPLTANYIHVQKRSEEFNIAQLPKNDSSLLVHYISKQKKILELFEKNAYNIGMKKLKDYFSQPIKHDSQLIYYYTIFNHLECNYEITSKEQLHKNLVDLYRYRGMDLSKSLLPITFRVNHNLRHTGWDEFMQYYNKVEEKVYIVKPGRGTNCGQGIKVMSDPAEILEYTKSSEKISTWIVQKYIERPMLIQKRKFDIRIYGLVSTIHGNMQAFFSRYCYVRTTSKEYTLEDLSDPLIHLSNDAVQKEDANYGKYEDHNKMSIRDFDKDYLYPRTRKSNYFYDVLWPQMRDEFRNLMLSVKRKLDPHRRHHGFEILGFDYMLDENLKLYLIEINYNPCLGIYGCSVLDHAITNMRTDVFNMTVNKLYYNYEGKNSNWDTVYDDKNDL